jgi:lysozyme family protein
MTNNFDKIMEFVFKWEGWKSDDADDAGGRTVWGITERDYPNEFPALWNMTKEDAQVRAKFIFHQDYWDKIDGDNLPNGTDAVILDVAINMGRHFALQLKPLSMNDAFIERINRYVQIAAQGNNIKFLRGWLRRTIDLYYFVKQNFS